MPIDPVALLARLVAQPTVAGESNVALIELLAHELEQLGATVTVVGGPRPDALNLHATIGPPATSGILFAAHTDVVAVEGQPWTVDPWQLTDRGQRLYGRGTADMKGFIAAMLAGIDRIDARRLRRPVQFAFSSDEELGCLGVPPLLDFLAELEPRPAACVVGEPTGLRVATGHKGKVSYRVTVTGRASHSSLAPAGVNAVEYAAELIVALRQIGSDLAQREPSPGYGVPHATVSCGPIEGGVAVNIVPDRCRFDFEVRTLPGQSDAALLRSFGELARGLERRMREVAPEAAIAIEPLAGYPGLRQTGAAQDDLTAVVAASGDAGAIVVDFGTEAGLYQEALGIPVIVCGPGSMEQAHRADEYIARDQLLAACDLVARLGSRCIV